MDDIQLATSAIKVQDLDIYRAAQLGDIARCKEIVEQKGPEVLLEHDERGHTALHWACLAGHNDIVRYFILCNAPLDKPSNNELGPKPIHWACVNGHIVTVDLLLQHGVSINTTDKRSCTPLIIATQYGKTMLVGYLIGKGARKDFTDIDGDTALHWAAFKGHPEIAQLLIHSGFNPRQKDDVGQTPIHLACLSGNIKMVRLVMQHNPDLYLKDNNGKTALALAKGRNYKDIIGFLERRMKINKYCSFCSQAFNMLGGQRRHLFFLLLGMLAFSYPMYFYHFQYLWAEFRNANILFFIFNVPMWYFFVKTSQQDPGFVPPNKEAYDLTLKQISLNKQWEENSVDNPLSRLCHTCLLVRPRRAKHCSLCGRCVLMMDHHCNYVNSCIGKKNRVYFFFFLISFTTASYIAIYLAKQVVSAYGWTFLRVVFALLYGFFGPMFGFLLLTTLYLGSFNLTTNERINKDRYLYLKDDKGNFKNPYDRGFVKNWLEFLNLIPPLNLEIDRNEGDLFAV